MSSEIAHAQNPTTTFPNIPPKVTKNKQSKRSRVTKTNKTNNNNITNSVICNNNDKPLKVVYISNPMRFNVNADEFQTLVQELTGRDAVEWPYEGYTNLARDVAREGVIHQELTAREAVQWPEQVDSYGSSSEVSLDYFGPFDSDVDNGQMVNIEELQDLMYGNDDLVISEG